MKLTVKAGGVPTGSYVAKFAGVEQRDHAQYGPGLLWQFEIVSGPNAGAKATGMTGTVPTTQNKCGKFLAGVTGKPLAVGESIDLTPFVGTRYLIVVEQAEKGSRIVSITAPPA
jgi:hypothetical protein